MSSLKRRHFLQAAGSTIATIGLSQLDLFPQANCYGRMLAQGSPGRKLALLVGINAYPDGVSSLRGCLTDVQLQQELLVHRFGFNPNDILIVSDTTPLKPTRHNILTAFETHLIQQAKPGDVVVFHFSGHGSLVRDPNPLPELLVNQDGTVKAVANTQQVNGTIVPYDRPTPDPDRVQDIMGRSLFLLMQALKTEQVTMVLDSCHSGGGTRGNLVFRSVPSRLNGDTAANPSAEELEFQRRWMKALNLSESELMQRRQRGIAKGVAIGSAQYDQLAADAPFDNESFYAGAFTYVLTRYLWQQSAQEAVGTVFVNLARSTRDIANRSRLTQEPLLATNPASNQQQPVYFLQPSRPFAEAVVQEVGANGVVKYWLGGLSSLSLETNAKGTLFSVIDASGQEVAQIEQEDRQGLVGVGRVRLPLGGTAERSGSIKAVQPGVLLRERVRGLPTDLMLKIGLDPSLGSDQDAARAALKALDRIEGVSSQHAINYMLGRMTLEYQQLARSTDPPTAGSIGLFTSTLNPMTPTFGPPGESVADAIARLAPRLKSLLAAEVLRAIGGIDPISNGKTAGLAVAIVPTGKTGGQVTPNQFQPGTEIEVRLKNTNPHDLFVAVVSIGSAGNLRVLYPYFDAPEGADRIPAGKELALPEPGVVFPLSHTPGSLEIMVLASRTSIYTALKALKTIATRGGVSSRGGLSQTPMQGDDALDAMAALLGNLDSNTRASLKVRPGVQAVDATQIAVISRLIEVVQG